MICSICIATYKRPELLKKLLEGLSNQVIPEDIEVEIIVVDNDSSGSAKNIVEQVVSALSMKIKYFIQPEKNISLTRNLAVENSNGELILFIDDDEIADKNWVKCLIQCVQKYNADGAFGTVKSYFDNDIPKWLRKSFIYNRKSFKSGTVANYTRTGNCIVKSSILRKISGPFDPGYGISGGGDTNLFGKLKKRGAKFVNCNEAITYEYVPRERTTIKWQIKRALRIGNNYTRRSIELANEKRFQKRLSHFFKSSLFFMVCTTLFVITVPVRRIAFHWLLKASSNLGKITAVFNFSINEYK